MQKRLIGTHPYTPFLWLMTLPEKRRKAIRGKHGDGSGGVHAGNDEMWRSRMNRREAETRGAGRKAEKRRNATWRKNFDYNALYSTPSREGPTWWVWLFTRILIVVHVLASSYSESKPRQAATRRPGRSQLLAQHQALHGHVFVTVKDQYPATAILASEWTAHCHV